MPPDTEEETKSTVQPDMVNSPAHYRKGGIECIDAIRAALTPEEFRGFCKGNAIKYLFRANDKGSHDTDVAKADWYVKKQMAVAAERVSS